MDELVCSYISVIAGFRIILKVIAVLQLVVYFRLEVRLLEVEASRGRG